MASLDPFKAELAQRLSEAQAQRSAWLIGPLAAGQGQCAECPSVTQGRPLMRFGACRRARSNCSPRVADHDGEATGADMDKDYLTLKRAPMGRTSKTTTCSAAATWSAESSCRKLSRKADSGCGPSPTGSCGIVPILPIWGLTAKIGRAHV